MRWISNPTFEADRVSVTAPIGWSASNGANSKDGRTGNWSWQLTGNASLSQSVAALPNGTYTLSIWSKSSGAGAVLAVKNHGGADKTVMIPASTDWTNVTIGGIAASSGHADVSVTSSGQTVNVDA